jgi:hypothetical protein
LGDGEHVLHGFRMGDAARRRLPSRYTLRLRGSRPRR